jgi:hypothetical protein
MRNNEETTMKLQPNKPQVFCIVLMIALMPLIYFAAEINHQEGIRAQKQHDDIIKVRNYDRGFQDGMKSVLNHIKLSNTNTTMSLEMIDVIKDIDPYGNKKESK